ncbi:hypothetical protein BJ508DRAFT_380649 [Ascobolus immersus RN42]|uniref:Disintegrin domain-containing protein n=1 Tax=Ascobolus immersus RN42 TaxID=1160509 RepID=A0A3N4HKC5_ASCIM|nr:hypothetical protein BJ508DRAFT_380649 [Ascobolus immersus RN42]
MRTQKRLLLFTALRTCTALFSSASFIGFNASSVEPKEKVTGIYVVIEVPPPEDSEHQNPTNPVPPISSIPEQTTVPNPHPEPGPPPEHDPTIELPEENQPQPEIKPPELPGKPSKCGNGVLDEGEDCDCGDRCPTDEAGNIISCCNMQTCKWAEVKSVCDSNDPLHSDCCQACTPNELLATCLPAKEECDPTEDGCNRDLWCQLYSSIDLGSLFNNSLATIDGYCLTSIQDRGQTVEEIEVMSKNGCKVECIASHQLDEQSSEVGSTCISPPETAAQIFPDGMDCSDGVYGNGTCFGGVCIRTGSIPTAVPTQRPTPNQDSSESSQSISKGTIVGAVLGSVAGLILILALFTLFLRKRTKKLRSRQSIHSHLSEQSDSQLDLIIESILAASKRQQRTQERFDTQRTLRYRPSRERINKMPTISESPETTEGAETLRGNRNSNFIPGHGNERQESFESHRKPGSGVYLQFEVKDKGDKDDEDLEKALYAKYQEKGT